MSLQVKICGLTNAEDAITAAQHGAAMLGFVFFEPSPRNLTMKEALKLANALPDGPDRVGVFVDADNELIDDAIHALDLDWVQLHGTESPARVAEIAAAFNVGIIKAIPISSADDFKRVAAYIPHVDVFLFDAKTDDCDPLPGGMGKQFDWALLCDQTLEKPWILAGGLSLDNLIDAVSKSGATAVDLSSSLEEKRGIKDLALIKAFLESASVL